MIPMTTTQATHVAARENLALDCQPCGGSGFAHPCPECGAATLETANPDCDTCLGLGGYGSCQGCAGTGSTMATPVERATMRILDAMIQSKAN